MSVILTSHFWTTHATKEMLEVEIFRDGAMEFPGRDFRYELAMAEFSPPRTVAVRLYERWKKEPELVIFGHLELPDNSIVGLAADFAEHVLQNYEKHHDDNRLRIAIESARKYVSGEMTDPYVLGNISWNAISAGFESEFTASDHGRFAAHAAGAAANAASVLLRNAADADFKSVGAAMIAALNAKKFMAYSACIGFIDTNSEEWKQAYQEESLWQIRRFVDCMEAVGQGLPWPLLEATK